MAPDVPVRACGLVGDLQLSAIAVQLINDALNCPNSPPIFALRADKQCCSAYNRCGGDAAAPHARRSLLTATYCAAGCQSAFGMCLDASASGPGSDTARALLSIARRVRARRARALSAAAAAPAYGAYGGASPAPAYPLIDIIAPAYGDANILSPAPAPAYGPAPGYSSDTPAYSSAPAYGAYGASHRRVAAEGAAPAAGGHYGVIYGGSYGSDIPAPAPAPAPSGAPAVSGGGGADAPAPGYYHAAAPDPAPAPVYGAYGTY